MDSRNKNGQFIKGHKGAKPKGAISAKTEQWNELGEYIVDKGAKKYMDYITSLKDRDYADRFEKILEYFKPRQQRTEIKGEIKTEPKKIGFEE